MRLAGRRWPSSSTISSGSTTRWALLLAGLQDQPDRPLTQLIRVLPRCWHDTTLPWPQALHETGDGSQRCPTGRAARRCGSARTGAGWWCGPAAVAVVQVGGQPLADWFGQQDDPAVDVQPPVLDVGQLQPAQMSRARPVEGDERDERGLSGVVGVETGADRLDVAGIGWRDWRSPESKAQCCRADCCSGVVVPSVQVLVAAEHDERGLGQADGRRLGLCTVEGGEDRRGRRGGVAVGEADVRTEAGRGSGHRVGSPGIGDAGADRCADVGARLGGPSGPAAIPPSPSTSGRRCRRRRRARAVPRGRRADRSGSNRRRRDRSARRRTP
jgi:hypothetical protein